MHDATSARFRKNLTAASGGRLTARESGVRAAKEGQTSADMIVPRLIAPHAGIHLRVAARRGVGVRWLHFFATYDHLMAAPIQRPP
jgi:hypothetical protein